MTKLIISDLHLDENRAAIADIFLTLLKKELRRAEALYILGDLFESWIGDDDLTDFHQMIIQHLKQATAKGSLIFIMHGNRDFLLGKRFFQMTGCYYSPDFVVTDIGHRRTLLMHGDLLCTQDVDYLKFRKRAHHWLAQKLFLWKSLEKRRKIAQAIRQKSQQHTSTTAEHIMDVTQSEVERLMLQHQVQHLIHGHTHREAVHHFSLNQQPATRTVLGAWHDHGNMLVCEDSGKQEVVILN